MPIVIKSDMAFAICHEEIKICLPAVEQTT